MTKSQIDKFAVGYPYPTDYIEILLRKYNFDKAKVHEILCKSKDEVVKEVQTSQTEELLGKFVSFIDEHSIPIDEEFEKTFSLEQLKIFIPYFAEKIKSKL